MLLNIAANCVLPKLWNGSKLPGRGVEVVYICTDYKFDLLRLVTILEGKVHGHAGKAEITGEDQVCHEPTGIQHDDDSHRELIKSCLGRVHIHHCNSSAELLFALHSLKTFLRSHPEVCTLCLDHVGSFYWVDRSECGGTRQSSEYRQQLWVSALSELIQEHHLVVFAARPLLFMARDRGEGPSSYGSGWVSCDHELNLLHLLIFSSTFVESVREVPIRHTLGKRSLFPTFSCTRSPYPKGKERYTSHSTCCRMVPTRKLKCLAVMHGWFTTLLVLSE